jgi:hypothetical protein
VVAKVAAAIYVAANVPQPGQPNEESLPVGRLAVAPLAAGCSGQGHAEGAPKKLLAVWNVCTPRAEPGWTGRTAKLLASRPAGPEHEHDGRVEPCLSSLFVELVCRACLSNLVCRALLRK